MLRFKYQYVIDGSQAIVPGRPPATVNAAAANRFETAIHQLLKTIDEDTSVGQHILKSTGLSMAEIRIVPSDLPTPVNTLPLKPADSLVRDRKEGRFTGTGLGSDAFVFVSPRAIGLSGPATQPDAALLHELVHGIRINKGVFARVSVPQYEDEEEFYAITLANTYISSRYPGASLRGDHGAFPLHRVGGYPQITRFLTSPGLTEQKLYYFVQEHREKILKLIEQMEGLCFALKDARCKFNPFRVAYRGYDPNVEEASLPPAQRRKTGYGPLVAETFAEAADRAMKDADPEKMRRMFGGE